MITQHIIGYSPAAPYLYFVPLGPPCLDQLQDGETHRKFWVLEGVTVDSLIFWGSAFVYFGFFTVCKCCIPQGFFFWRASAFESVSYCLSIHIRIRSLIVLYKYKYKVPMVIYKSRDVLQIMYLSIDKYLRRA